jgi:hypothetical protein
MFWTANYRLGARKNSLSLAGANQIYNQIYSKVNEGSGGYVS